MQNKANVKMGNMNVSILTTVNYINKLRTMNYELIMKNKAKQSQTKPIFRRENPVLSLSKGPALSAVLSMSKGAVEGACLQPQTWPLGRTRQIFMNARQICKRMKNAANVYDRAARKYYDEFAVLNFGNK